MPLQVMAAAAWILPSLAALLAAWAVQKQGGVQKVMLTLSSSLHKQSQPEPQYATWVIGDLHGDVHCAEHWVQRTGLVQDNTNGKGKEDSRNRPKRSWTDPTSHLVFVGDYVDKGPQSRQVVEFVKGLTDDFPDQVTALMGNHEMELLLDRDETRWDSWGGTGYFGLAYSSVHPGEYLNYIETTKGSDEDIRDIETGETTTTTATKTHEQQQKLDELIVDALYNASAEVYGNRLHQKLRMAPEEHVGNNSMLSFIPDPTLRAQAATRLQEYQKAYMDTYRSGTELGTWLEQRPIVAQINDTIFVHGGISNYGSALLKQDGVEEINRLFASQAHESTLNQFITQTQRGQIIYDMLTFRGNHKEGACATLPKLLPDGVTRLGVGHTPNDSVRSMCDGNFWALDSSLGRWFRNSGNMYCHGRHQVTSSNGRYVCTPKKEHCEGQIAKLTANGQAEVIQ